jgi:hypothetical protein
MSIECRRCNGDIDIYPYNNDIWVSSYYKIFYTRNNSKIFIICKSCFYDIFENFYKVVDAFSNYITNGDNTLKHYLKINSNKLDIHKINNDISDQADICDGLYVIMEKLSEQLLNEYFYKYKNKYDKVVKK